MKKSLVVGAGLAIGLPRLAWANSLRRASDPAPRADPTFYKWKEVAPGFQVAMARNPDDMMLVGGNSTLLVKEGGGVLIDTKQAVLGPALRREALALTGAITTVINTHHHADHVGGNAACAKGAKLIAHPKCHDRVAASISTYTAQLDQKIEALGKSDLEGAKAAAADARAFKAELANIKPEAFIPEGSLVSDGKPVDLAGHNAEVHHVGPGHTDNDVFLFFPKENVLVTGDLVFSGLHAYYDDTGGANSQGWIKSLGRIVQLCNDKTVVVPGHGEITDLEGVKRQIKYFEDVNAAVAKAIKDGKTREEVAKMTLPQYSEYGLKVAQPLVMGGVYDELKKA